MTGKDGFYQVFQIEKSILCQSLKLCVLNEKEVGHSISLFFLFTLKGQVNAENTVLIYLPLENRGFPECLCPSSSLLKHGYKALVLKMQIQPQ